MQDYTLSDTETGRYDIRNNVYSFQQQRLLEKEGYSDECEKRANSLKQSLEKISSKRQDGFQPESSALILAPFIIPSQRPSNRNDKRRPSSKSRPICAEYEVPPNVSVYAEQCASPAFVC